MKSSILVDSAKFEEIINSLEKSYKRLQEISLNEKNNKEIINGTDVWTGTAQNAMYNKYNTLTDSFEKIDYSLDIYIKFLKKTLEDYKLAEQEIGKNIDQIANELNVNS